MRMNLMDANYPVDRDVDVVFCRNVLIYFNRATQQAVLERLCSHLRPGGYLFLGHSESAAGSAVGAMMRTVAPTIMRRN
jgi:chemotaxis protein methyltransferase CheR